MSQQRRPRSVSLNDEEARHLRELGGSKWLREAIAEEYARRPAFTKSRPLPVDGGGTVVFRRHAPFAAKPPPDNPLGLEPHERINYAYVPPIVIKIRPEALARIQYERMSVTRLRSELRDLKKSKVRKFISGTGDEHILPSAQAYDIAAEVLTKREKPKSTPPAKKARKTKP